jgi:hypothetical protein
MLLIDSLNDYSTLDRFNTFLFYSFIGLLSLNVNLIGVLGSVRCVVGFFNFNLIDGVGVKGSKDSSSLMLWIGNCSLLFTGIGVSIISGCKSVGLDKDNLILGNEETDGAGAGVL